MKRSWLLALGVAALMSAGMPLGKVGNATSVTKPAISQWPTVVSLPCDSEAALPQAPVGASTGLTHESG